MEAALTPQEVEAEGLESPLTPAEVAAEGLGSMEPKKFGKAESFAMGFPRLGGLVPALYGGIGAANAKARELTQGLLPGAAQDVLFGKPSPGNPTGDYAKGKAEFEQARGEAEQQNPKSFTAGNAATSLLLPLPGVGATKGLTGLAKLAALAKGGAKVGAAVGASNTSADLTNFSTDDMAQALKDTGLGAAIGAIGTPAFAPVAALLEKALAVPVGAFGRFMEKKGIDDGRRVLSGGANPLAVKKPVSDAAVREAFEQGAIKPLGTTQSAADVLDTARGAVGDQYGKVVDSLDRFGVKGPDPRALAQDMASEGASIEANSVGTGVPDLYQNTAAELENKAGPMPGSRLGLKQAEDIKRSLQERARYDKVQGNSLMEDARKDLASRVRQAVEDAVEQGTAKHPDPVAKALGEEFKPLKEQLGRIIEASDAADKGAAQAARRQQMPLTSKMVGAGAGSATLASTGNPLAAAAAGKGAAEGMSIIQKRGPSTSAAFNYGIGKSFMGLAERMATHPSVAGTKFGVVLNDARRRGPEALAVAHMKLSDNPEYQELAKTVGGEGDTQ